MPPEQAVLVAERLGLEVSRCFLHREAHRQGLKAQEVRSSRLDQLDTWHSLQELAHSDSPAVEPFTLIIEIDAWNIREREYWGETEAMRKKDPHWSRWHWVYVGTVFRLNHRGQTDGGRAIISERGYAATRLGIDALMRQLYRQAIDCGLGQAKEVLVIADGAVWIWNAAQDRFPQARNRLDLYHTAEQKTKANEPLGSGAVESTCRQYQCRFKRTGQFWTMAGDEALMCLETFWRNRRWHDLFPHSKPPSLANN